MPIAKSLRSRPQPRKKWELDPSWEYPWSTKRKRRIEKDSADTNTARWGASLRKSVDVPDPSVSLLPTHKELMKRLELTRKLMYHCDKCANQNYLYPMDDPPTARDSEEYKALCAANLAKDRERLHKKDLDLKLPMNGRPPSSTSE